MIGLNLVVRSQISVSLSNTEVVNDVIQYDTYQKIIIQKKTKKIILYDSNMSTIKPGYKITFDYKESSAFGERVEGGFDYNKYLLNNNYLNKTYSITSIDVINKGFNHNTIKYYLLEYINKYYKNESASFIKGLVLGDTSDFSDEFKLSIKDNGIMHLFAISGLHIGLIILVLNKILAKLKAKNKIIAILLTIYLIITAFSPSVLRAVLMYFIALINKTKRLRLSSIDILSITLLILLIIYPYYMYNSGFVLSFLISSFIILISKIIDDRKNITKTIIITVMSNILVLPITVNMNNEFNLLAPITSVLFIYLVSFVYLPLSFITLFLPFIARISDTLFQIFIKLSTFLSDYFSINIICKEISKPLFALFYLSIFILLAIFKNRNIKIIYKKVVLGMLIGQIVFTFCNTTLKNEVHFLDLDEGDATLILTKECRALIDTGTGKNSEVLNLLKRKGIKNLDYLVITHPHLDHYGEAKDIIKRLNVKKLIVNGYDNYNYGINSIKLFQGDSFTCGGIRFDVLSPSASYNDENDNGLVLYSKIDGLGMLFLADVSKRVEDNIAKYDLDIDLIKIAHHGSNTSTSKKLISKYLPKYTVIEVGRSNKYNFPSYNTISLLEGYNIKIYRTDLDYSIIYKFKKGKGYFVKMNDN